jgi:hypothetical protein
MDLKEIQWEPVDSIYLVQHETHGELEIFGLAKRQLAFEKKIFLF